MQTGSAVINLSVTQAKGISAPYAAPEMLTQIASNAITEFDDCKASDVYSFAITLWEILHRKIPWEGLTRDEIRQKVVANSRPTISDRLQAVGTEDTKLVFMRELIKECWQQNPIARPDFRTIAKQRKTVMDVEDSNQNAQINTSI